MKNLPKLFQIVKQNKFLSTITIFYIFSIFYMKEVIFLFYNSTDSPDFTNYFRFIEYSFNITNDTQSEQGFFFYNLHSNYFYIRNFNFSPNNFFILFSRSIQELNTIFFLIGSMGIYRLLKIYNYTNLQIVTSLVLINYLPLTVALRMVLKPEILVFAFLPWLIVCYEEFIISKNCKYLYLSVPLLLPLITQKGSISAMVVIFLLIYYFPKIFLTLIRNHKKDFFAISFLIIFLFNLTIIENSSINNIGFTDLQSGSQSEVKYDNKGKISLFYKLNPEKLIFYPYKHLHSESAIHITFLDSFGDYFDLYWNSDSSNFYQTRHELFVFEYSESAKIPSIDLENKIIKIYTQNEINNYFVRRTTSVIAAIYFYYLLIYFYLKVEKNKKKFFTLPFIGITLLLMHVISGFPQNNFDPLIGDTLKPLYYGFFIIISFSFTISELIKSKISSFLFLILFIPTFMFIFGFPRDYHVENVSKVVEVNSYSEMCRFNYYIFKFENLPPSYKTCDSNENPIYIKSDYKNSNNFKIQPRIRLVNSLLTMLSSFSLAYLFFYKFNLNKLLFFNRLKNNI